MNVTIIPLSPDLADMADKVAMELTAASPLRAVTFRAERTGLEALEETAEAFLATGNLWADWFKFAKHIRAELGLNGRNQVLAILSDRPLPRRWFSIHEQPGVVIVDATGWDRFLPEDQTIFALAHLVASNALATQAFPTMADWQRIAHQDTRGCIMDLCVEKSGILAKLRAADLCPSCANHYRGLAESGTVHRTVFRQIMEVLDGIRRHLLNATLNEWASIDLQINVIGPRATHLRIRPFDVDIKLPPKQMALFLLGAMRPQLHLRSGAFDDEDWSDWDCLVTYLRSRGRSLAVPMNDAAFRTELYSLRSKFRAKLGRDHEASLIFEDRPGRGVRVRSTLREAITIENADLKMHIEHCFPVENLT